MVTAEQVLNDFISIESSVKELSNDEVTGLNKTLVGYIKNDPVISRNFVLSKEQSLNLLRYLKAIPEEKVFYLVFCILRENGRYLPFEDPFYDPHKKLQEESFWIAFNTECPDVSDKWYVETPNAKELILYIGASPEARARENLQKPQ